MDRHNGTSRCEDAFKNIFGKYHLLFRGILYNNKHGYSTSCQKNYSLSQETAEPTVWVDEKGNYYQADQSQSYEDPSYSQHNYYYDESYQQDGQDYDQGYYDDGQGSYEYYDDQSGNDYAYDGQAYG